ncbi:hypothetical protein ACRRTK_001396 [Alexandromys fortis]
MPFHQRSVEPARLRRPEETAVARAAGAPLFRSLEQVSSHTLVCLLAQLADLSRCAGDIFGELEGLAAALGHRTAELHRRLDALHAATARLDHRRVKIHKPVNESPVEKVAVSQCTNTKRAREPVHSWLPVSATIRDGSGAVRTTQTVWGTSSVC